MLGARSRWTSGTCGEMLHCGDHGPLRLAIRSDSDALLNPAVVVARLPWISSAHTPGSFAIPRLHVWSCPPQRRPAGAGYRFAL